MIEADKFTLEGRTVKEQIDKFNSKKEIKKKKPTLWDKAFRKGKLNKPNKIAVLFLRESGVAEPMELESRGGFINIYGKTYHEDRDCIYRLGKEKYPLAIIPEWNVIPIEKKEWEDKAMQEKFSTLQDHVMKGIRHAERVRMGEHDYPKMNPKVIIVWAIIIVVVGAILWGYVGK